MEKNNSQNRSEKQREKMNTWLRWFVLMEIRSTLPMASVVCPNRNSEHSTHGLWLRWFVLMEIRSTQPLASVVCPKPRHLSLLYKIMNTRLRCHLRQRRHRMRMV